MNRPSASKRLVSSGSSAVISDAAWPRKCWRHIPDEAVDGVASCQWDHALSWTLVARTLAWVCSRKSIASMRHCVSGSVGPHYKPALTWIAIAQRPDAFRGSGQLNLIALYTDVEKAVEDVDSIGWPPRCGVIHFGAQLVP